MTEISAVESLNESFVDFIKHSDDFKAAIGQGTSSLNKDIAQLITEAIPTGLKSFFDGKYKIKGSIGQGRVTSSPWIAIMNKNITTSTTKGVYVVIFFTDNFSNVYISLNQGVTGKSEKELIYLREGIRKEIKPNSSLVRNNNDFNCGNKKYAIGSIYGGYWDFKDSKHNVDLINELKHLYEDYTNSDCSESETCSINKTWIVPCNNDLFRLIDLFQERDIIDWRQHNKYQVGDIVYIYNSGAYKRILQKVEVIRIDVPANEYLNDTSYWGEDYKPEGDLFVRFKKIAELNADDTRLSLNIIKKKGLNGNIQSPLTIDDKPELLSYIEQVFNTPFEMAGMQQNPFNINKAKEYINDTQLIYDDVFFKRYVYSLLTKPFVILSGLAGSGKTQLALAFAKAMVEDEAKQMRVVSVGADWTNREPLLGYPNALKEGEYVHPESGVLDLLIECNKKENKNKPFFLILDEMNLSYVERYFADFLSAMESHQEISLWDADVDNDDIVPSTIGLPKNLFIVGTINVDETTYMFSPKVLDRANVIEFQVSADDMIKFLSEAPSVDVETIKGKCANMAADFVRIASEKVEASTEANEILGNFFKVLKVANAEFGYRTASEIGRFLSLSKDDLSIDVATDSAIVQKLLPKLHGSRKKMVDVLKALFDICKKDGADTSLEKIDEFDSSLFKYPISADKIVRMYKGAINNGYTSFAEA